MTVQTIDGPRQLQTGTDHDILLNALPHPLLLIAKGGRIGFANAAAEDFFQVSETWLCQHDLEEFIPFGSPLLALIDWVRKRGAAVNEYAVDLGLPRNGAGRLVDIQVTPLAEKPGALLVMLQERTMAKKIERQLSHRGAARSVTGLAAMLAHEIKNPLSGIRGAAQLIETSLEEDDRTLTRLICDETDRICDLVDRMEVFGDERPMDCRPVNIHAILGHVKELAEKGFASHIRIVEEYDPSLPPAYCSRDHLIQVFLNLLKNAAEAIGNKTVNGEIILTTAFRPGVQIGLPGVREPVRLPLEVCVKDNGPGVQEDMRPYLFDPFVTTKPSGKGLGLALVAKIVRDHGGIIECDSSSRGTVFQVLLPLHAPEENGAEEK